MSNQKYTYYAQLRNPDRERLLNMLENSELIRSTVNTIIYNLTKFVN